MPIDPNTTNKVTIPNLPELGRSLLDTDLLVGHDGNDMRRILGSRVRAFVQGSVVVPLLLSDGEVPLTTGNDKAVLYAPLNLDIANVLAMLSTAGTTLTEVDIKRNGASIFGTDKLTIDPTEFTSATAATPPSVTYPVQINALDRLALDVLQAGTGAVGLKVWLVATVRP